jgi:hypothetical protein
LEGSAAAAFTKAWERDSTGATALGLVISQTGDITDQLAVDLAKIENALADGERLVRCERANQAAGNWVPPRMSTPPSPSSAG